MMFNLASASLNFDWHFFWRFAFHPSAGLLKGLEITIYASVIAQCAGMAIGTTSALAALSRYRLLRILSALYVLFFRGTPLLVQMFLVYFGTPYLFGVDLFPVTIDVAGIDVPGAVVAGIVALSINEGAYMSEIFRGAIQAVPRGQVEAAKALGMTQRTLLRRVVLPQAFRIAIPPLGNEFNSLLK